MPSFPFDVVVFDLDGTLADSAPDLRAALNHVLRSLGRTEQSDEQVRAMIGNGVRMLLRRGLAATGSASEEEVDRATPLFMDYYAAHICDRTRAYPGVDAMLDAVAAGGAALAICTNKPEALTRALVDALGWSGRFRAIVGGDTLPVRKPDRAPLLEAVHRAGGGRAVLVGDSITDAETAAAAGLPLVAVGFGYRDRPATALGAAAVIDSFDDLPNALLRV
ncbi:phosphoglycolate phosphatase [Sphingosinicella sp. BN140058]|uniref:phosphoglycolate phosphatase n=1 Tax=Sphingosinicella sp. BN140058 TaxID=1892855 RepID=UPI001010C07E|nr:phosphoglycolate phosphatase [Sphingosinicella sp. BN140058]QAY75625.1 phosphoglycolate phosphatase [Sphingosinicella sp. BN140058]